ncbi:hypothetical protein D3C71_1879370 [compost metagenome]
MQLRVNDEGLRRRFLQQLAVLFQRQQNIFQACVSAARDIWTLQIVSDRLKNLSVRNS